MPYPDPARIVMVGTNTGAPKLAAWRQQTDIFTGLSAYRGGVVNITANITASQESAHRLALQVPWAGGRQLLRLVRRECRAGPMFHPR